MDLYQLRYFLEAAREENFTRAAESLHLSPPAVSQSMALLERSLGRKLFHRDGRRVSLTAEGKALLSRAQRIFDEVESAESELSGREAGSAELRLAAREMIVDYLLPPVLARLQAGHPGLRLALHELEPEAMAEALAKDQADGGYYYGPVADDRLEAERLGALRSRVYAAPALLRRLGRPKTVSQTLRLPFVAPRPFRDVRPGPSADGFPDDRLRRDVRYRAELLETHRALALQGLCAAVLPEGVAAADARSGRLAALPGPRLGREVYFFKRKGRRMPRALSEINAGLSNALKSGRWS